MRGTAVFVMDRAAGHTVFELKPEGCVRGTAAMVCSSFLTWLGSTGLAFLDAHLLGLSPAQAWLASSNITVASSGVTVWNSR